MDKDHVTIAVPNFVIGRADLPNDLVYQLVKAVFENQPRLLKATSMASETLPQLAGHFDMIAGTSTDAVGSKLMAAENPRYPDITFKQLECQGVWVGSIRRKVGSGRSW